MKKDKQSVVTAVLAGIVVLLAAVTLPPLFASGTPAEVEIVPAPIVRSQEDLRLDLNTATADELRSLPGIGPVLAQRILDRRGELGMFRSEEDILSVPGIGEKTLEKIRPYIRW